jgi:nucleotide-binding universal stress UspA family protein
MLIILASPLPLHISIGGDDYDLPKKILAPTDFSTMSVPAVGYALSLAKDHGAEVVVLHALPNEAMREHFSHSYAPGGLVPAEAPVSVARQPDIEGLIERKKQVLRTFLEQKIAPEVLKAVKVSASIKIGKVAGEIVAVA